MSNRTRTVPGVSFGGSHSLRDFGLVLQPYTIPLPEPKYDLEDLPGGNGSVDLTEASGDVLYHDRVFTLELHALDTQRRFDSLVATLANSIHGKRLDVVFDKDPLYHYSARCRVLELVPEGSLASIGVELTCAPFRIKNAATVKTYTIDQLATTIELPCDRMPVVPTVTTTGACSIRMSNGTVLTIDQAGTYVLNDLVLHEGTNTIILALSTAGTSVDVTFTYHEGRL